MGPMRPIVWLHASTQDGTLDGWSLPSVGLTSRLEWHVPQNDTRGFVFNALLFPQVALRYLFDF